MVSYWVYCSFCNFGDEKYANIYLQAVRRLAGAVLNHLRRPNINSVTISPCCAMQWQKFTAANCGQIYVHASIDRDRKTEKMDYSAARQQTICSSAKLSINLLVSYWIECSQCLIMIASVVCWFTDYGDAAGRTLRQLHRHVWTEARLQAKRLWRNLSRNFLQRLGIYSVLPDISDCISSPHRVSSRPIGLIW